MPMLYYGDVKKRAEWAGLVATDVERPATALQISNTADTERRVVRPNSVGLFDETIVNSVIDELKALA